MPAVGYDHPDQSHFVSRHFYEVGALDPQTTTGWLGRYLDRVGSPDNPLQGLALDNSLAPALAARRVPVAAVDSPTDYNFWARDVWGDIEPIMLDATARIGVVHQRSEPALAQVAAAAMHTGALRWQLAGLREVDGKRPFTPPVTYPVSEESDFPERLAALAAMLAAGLPLRCVAITAPGDYDTHANQAETLGEPLVLACDALAAFQRDLEARGLADRVLIHVWSEFGRRAAENSEGTDHGAAGLGLLIGTRAAGRMIGEFPGPRRARRARQPACDVRLPRASTPGCSSSGSAPRPTGSSPTPRASRGRSSSSDRGARRRARAGLPGARADAGHRRRVVAGQLASADRGGQARDPALQPRRGRARPRRAARRGRSGRSASPRRGPGSSARRRGGSSPGGTGSGATSRGIARRGCARASGSAVAEASAPGGVVVAGLRPDALDLAVGAGALELARALEQQGDELAGRAERIRDGVAVVDRQGGPRPCRRPRRGGRRRAGRAASRAGRGGRWRPRRRGRRNAGPGRSCQPRAATGRGLRAGGGGW